MRQEGLSLIKIHCDQGRQLITLYDTYLGKYIVAKQKRSGANEYKAIILALQYIETKYNGESIQILSDGKSEVDFLNGKVKHHINKIKNYAEIAQKKLSGMSSNHDIIISWIPRKSNIAGLFLEKNNTTRHDTIFSKPDVLQMEYPK